MPDSSCNGIQKFIHGSMNKLQKKILHMDAHESHTNHSNIDVTAKLNFVLWLPYELQTKEKKRKSVANDSLKKEYRLQMEIAKVTNLILLCYCD